MKLKKCISLQILLAKPTDNWLDALSAGKLSKLHILEPTSLQVKAEICVVDDDPRLPKTKIHGMLFAKQMVIWSNVISGFYLIPFS